MVYVGITRATILISISLLAIDNSFLSNLIVYYPTFQVIAEKYYAYFSPLKMVGQGISHVGVSFLPQIDPLCSPECLWGVLQLKYKAVFS